MTFRDLIARSEPVDDDSVIYFCTKHGGEIKVEGLGMGDLNYYRVPEAELDATVPESILYLIWRNAVWIK